MQWRSWFLLAIASVVLPRAAHAQAGAAPEAPETETPPVATPADPAPAAAPSATPQTPQGYPPGQAYPPGQPQYPPGYYPQPGAPPAYGPYPVGGHPAYPAYPPGYGPPGYGPQPAPAPRQPKAHYPDDAATQTSPFLDLLVAGIAQDKRFDHLFNVGMQTGAYLGGRVRVAARFIMLTSEPEDDLAHSSSSFGDDDLPDGFAALASDAPIIVYGGSLGFSVVARRSFAFSPGVIVSRTDKSDYGTFLGMSAPFEWVTDDGARFGFEVGFGRGFGGEVRGRCESFGTVTPCDPGEERKFDRPSGGAFYAHFQFGWGFNHPEPVMR